MKTILFINPAFNSGAQLQFWSSGVMDLLMSGKVVILPKLSGMIFAALTPPSFNFVYLDEDIEDIDFQADADLVAITAMTTQAPRAYAIAAEFRNAGKPVVIGGIHASVLPEETGEHCDAVIVGEGENIWPALLEDFERGALKKVYNSLDYPPVDGFVSPKIDVIKRDSYLLYPLQATRGCPYDCDFCSIKHSAGRRYRMKPVAQLIGEIKEFEKHNKKTRWAYKKGYQFVDDNLYVNREYAKELFSAMRGLGIVWTGQGGVNTAYDDEILELMAESGCRGYSIGFESLSEQSLSEVNKPKTNRVEDYKTAIDNLIRHGIVPAGFFIYGFDSDDARVFEKTVDFAITNHLIQPFFNVLTPYPGTRLHERIEAEGRIFDRNWENYNSMKCVFTPKHISPRELNSGAVWSDRRLAGLDVIVSQLDHFWKQGPWTAYKPIGVPERLILVLLGLKLRKYNDGYRKFLFWAAKQKNANDFGTIIAALAYNDMTAKFPEADLPQFLTDRTAG